eukprot:211520_1
MSFNYNYTQYIADNSIYQYKILFTNLFTNLMTLLIKLKFNCKTLALNNDIHLYIISIISVINICYEFPVIHKILQIILYNHCKILSNRNYIKYYYILSNQYKLLYYRNYIHYYKTLIIQQLYFFHQQINSFFQINIISKSSKNIFLLLK